MPTRIYKTPFAATGDKEALATADQPDGKVSLQAGWTPDYELPNDNANYRPVGRAEMNGVFNELTEALGEMQLNGFAKWQSIDGGWPLGAMVSHNGVVYQSVDGNNTTEPGTASVAWVAQLSKGAMKFLANGSFTVPAGITRVWVSGCGGGGGGGGGGASTSTTTGVAGGGGGSGDFVIDHEIAVTPGQTLTIQVGGAGLGGGAGTGSVKAGDGTSGGTSSVAGLIALPGGGGGKGGASSVSAGLSEGGSGFPAGGRAAPHSASPLVYSLGGMGASGPFGGAGAAGSSSAGAPSSGSQSYGHGVGGGGGGAQVTANGNGTAGGNGSPGLIVLEW